MLVEKGRTDLLRLYMIKELAKSVPVHSLYKKCLLSKVLVISVLFSTVHEVGREQRVCTIQECVLSRSMYHPGVCTIQEYVLSRSVYYPEVCTIQGYVL